MALAFGALFAIYVIWGTSFIAQRLAVEHLPPLVVAGTRYAAAGTLLAIGAVFTERRGRPAGPDLVRYVATGIAMFVGSGALLTYAIRFVPTGVTAILTATIPLWMVGIETARGHIIPSARIAAGLLIGILGVVVTAGPQEVRSDAFGPMLLILASAACWSIGSLGARHRDPHHGPLTVTAIQMMAGSVVLLAAAALLGDLQAVHPDVVAAEAWLALVWLVVPVGVVTFASYTYALRVLPASVVAIYPFANTVLAVVLGRLLLAEDVELRVLTGCVLVLLGAALIVMRTTTTSRTLTPV